MNIKDDKIDGGKSFDWGRVSEDYAKYRDIYPEKFYEKIVNRSLCIKCQKILDLGTGTGVLPRNMYRYGGKWTGTDISKEQIEQARLLSKGMDIEYLTVSAENIDFQEETFDVVTACQCFWYFNHERVMPIIRNILKKEGKLLILYMAWLPHEDKIAAESERLVLKYSPDWSGAGEFMRPIDIPEEYNLDFELVYHEEFPLNVHFTRESWNGRIKACRGIGASLTKEEISSWEKEHKKMLLETTPPDFDILHYAAIAELKVKK